MSLNLQNPTIQADVIKLQSALSLHQQGEIDKAAILYQEILESQPLHFDALQLLATISLQQGNVVAALELFDQAVQINPHHPGTLNNIGIALLELKRTEYALDYFERAFALQPDYADALNNSGFALLQLNRAEQALERFELAIDLQPSFTEAIYNCGNALLELNQFEQALDRYNQTLVLQPDDAEVLNNRGKALFHMQRLELARNSFDLAIDLKPDFVEALNNCGIALLDLNQVERALERFDQTLALQPDDTEVLNNRGKALFQMKRLELARDSFEQALDLKPDFKEALMNCGVALLELNQFEEALERFNLVLAKQPEDTEALMNLGKALFQLKRYQQALECFNKILWLLPNNQEALTNKEFTMRQLIFPWPATIVKKNREYNIAQWRIDRKQFREAHNRSSYLEMPFKHFIREVMSLTQKKQGEIDFDELFYLSANSDVEQAVASGSCLYGYIHFCMYGQYDNRPWSTRYLERVSGLAPNMPKGLAAPVNSAPLKIYGPDLSNLQRGDESLLFIFLPHLQDNLFFAGYSGFFNDLSKIFDQFSRIVVLVLASEVNPQLAKRYCNRIEVIAESDLMQIQKRPDIVFCFNSDTFYMAKNIFGNLDRTIYYCQDFEAGFYPYGTQFARAEGAVAQSHNIVLSTLLLKEFMEERKLLSAPRVFVTSPSIEILDVEPEKTKKIMFYFRPEVFNTRNMPELIMSVIEPFCLKHQGYEIFLVGSVDTSYSRKVYGTDVVILSKLPKEQYNSLLKSCDVVVAFIYSAHPGVIAFQAAASGIPTVTNIFEGRDAECLKSISENIVPFDPVRENLLDNIELALNMSKGKKSFNKARYEGASNQSFSQYVANIMQIN